MRYLFVLIGFCFSYISSSAQINSNNSLWEKISLAILNEKPVCSDTMLVMNTNRVLIPNQIDFFTHQTKANNETTVVLAVCKNLNWKIYIMNDINDAMKYMPTNRDLVFYIEGVGKNFPKALQRAASVTNEYKVNVIMFDYPTLKEGLGLIKNYYFSLKNAKSSTISFANYLQNIQNAFIANEPWIVNKNKTLFIHSLGNRLLSETIVQNKIPLLDTNLFNNIVLNAPCVKQYNHAKWVNKINFSSQKLIHYNKKDYRLFGAFFIIGRLLLGSYIHKPLAQNTIYVNFEHLLEKQHNGFITNPGVFTIPEKSHNYFSDLFHGKHINFNDSTQFEKLKSKNMFLIKN